MQRRRKPTLELLHQRGVFGGLFFGHGARESGASVRAGGQRQRSGYRAVHGNCWGTGLPPPVAGGYRTATRSGRDQGDLPVAGEDIHHDLEVGWALALLQGVQLARNGPRVEGARGFQLGLQPLACASSSQCGAAVLDITPDHRGPLMAGQHAMDAMQQIIQGVQAWPELPVLAGHEHAVDLRVQAGDVVNGTAFDLQDERHMSTVALFPVRWTWLSAGCFGDPCWGLANFFAESSARHSRRGARRFAGKKTT